MNDNPTTAEVLAITRAAAALNLPSKVLKEQPAPSKAPKTQRKPAHEWTRPLNAHAAQAAVERRKQGGE